MGLNDRFPSLAKDIAQYGVTFEWHCSLPSEKFVCTEKNSTTISIPQGASGNPDLYSIDHKTCRQLENQIGCNREKIGPGAKWDGKNLDGG